MTGRFPSLQNFKLFFKCKTDHDKQHRGAGQPPSPMPVAKEVLPSYTKLVEQLANIDKLLQERGTRYLLGTAMTEYDCELMPRLHHIRIAGGQLCGVEIPHNLVHLWNYMLTAYRTAAFIAVNFAASTR